MLNTCKMKFYFVKSGLFEQKRRFLNIMTCKIRRLGYEIPAALLTERVRPVRGSVFLVRHIPEQQDGRHGTRACDRKRDRSRARRKNICQKQRPSRICGRNRVYAQSEKMRSREKKNRSESLTEKPLFSKRFFLFYYVKTGVKKP